MDDNEKLDKRLKAVIDSEVPEKMRFRIPESESDFKVVRFRKKTFATRMAAGAFSVLAAAAFICIPAGIILKNAGTVSTGYSDKKYNSRFERYMDEYDYELTHNSYKKIYNSGSETEKKIFSFLGLIPEIEQGYNAEIFVRTLGEEDEIYTRQAYAVWYDHNGEINAIMPTSEKADGYTYEADFPGEKGAENVINNLLDSFSNRNRAVSFEGTLVRPQITGYSDVAAQTDKKDVRCMINNGDYVIPVRVCSIDYTVYCEIFSESNPLPSTTMDILVENGMTKYSTVLAYDCSRKNAVRIKSVSQDIWLEKAERN